MKYIGNEEEEGNVEKKGLNQMDKTFVVEGARISYSIWEVEGIIIFFQKLIFFIEINKTTLIILYCLYLSFNLLYL